jgi:hypothetical protein
MIDPITLGLLAFGKYLPGLLKGWARHGRRTRRYRPL